MELTPRTIIPASWFVTYEWTGSKYYDSPLRFRKCTQGFPSYQAAREFADAPHPELPDFKVTAFWKQGEIRDYGPAGLDPRSATARRNSDRCTDIDIIRANSRFK